MNKIAHKYTYILIFFEISMILLFMMKLPNDDLFYTIEFVGKFSTISLLINMLALFLYDKKLDFFKIFILFSYLFSFGQCILYVLNYHEPPSAFSIFTGYFNSTEIYNSTMFILLAISIMCIGYCITPISKTRRVIVKGELLHSDKLCRIAWSLILVCAIPTIYLLLLDINNIITTGYTSTINEKNFITQISIIMSGFFSSSLILLYCFEKKHRYLLYFIIVVYIIIYLAGGSRIEVFRLFVIMFLISYVYHKSIGKKEFIFIILTLVFLSFIFTLVSNIRIYLFFINDLDSFISQSARDLFTDNFIFKSVNEMGITQIINTLVYSNCPDTINFNYGLSFLRSLYGVFPNVFGITYSSMDTVFSPMYTLTSSGLGGSYLLELYWNFGYLSFIMFFFVGSFIKIIWIKFYNISNSENGSASKLFLLVWIMYILIFWVRTDSVEFFRTFVYYGLGIAILNKIKIKI